MTKRCDIPSATLGLCDLEWGHVGDMHASGGDGFGARAYEADHAKRQVERAKDDPAFRLRAHCAERIAECRKVEKRFMLALELSNRASTMPQGVIESWTERQTLQRVLAILDGAP